jgi:hypothetical protein
MNLSRFLVPHQLCLRCLKFFCFVHEWQDSILHRILNHALLRIIDWGKNQVHRRPLELLFAIRADDGGYAHGRNFPFGNRS